MSTTIRTDMHRDNRDGPEHYSSACLDQFIYKAYTAHTREEANDAESHLNDVQGQCLKHIRFLTNLQDYCRYFEADDKAGFAIDGAAYAEVVNFIAGIGASLAGVTHQLGFDEATEVVSP